MQFHFDSRIGQRVRREGRIELRGWWLSDLGESARRIVVRTGKAEVPLSVERREDLAPLVAGSRDLWAGFRGVVWCPRGMQRMQVVAEAMDGTRTVFCEKTIFSACTVRNPWQDRPFSLGFGDEKESYGGTASVLSAVHVVGVFFEQRSDLSAWMEHLRAEADSLSALSVHVVDHSSQPLSPGAMDGAGFSYHWNPANPGFGAGCNAGAADADAAYLLFLNPDARLRPGSLACLVAEAERTRALGFVGWEGTEAPVPHPRFCHPRTGETDWCSGACWLVDRTAFSSVGGFDENLFLYGEDVELSWRLRAAGGRLKRVHGAVFDHLDLPGTDLEKKRRREEKSTRWARAYLRGKYPSARIGDHRTGTRGRLERGAWRQGRRAATGQTRAFDEVGIDPAGFAPHRTRAEEIPSNVLPPPVRRVALQLEADSGPSLAQRWRLQEDWTRGLSQEWEVRLLAEGESPEVDEWLLRILPNWIPFQGILDRLVRAACCHRSLWTGSLVYRIEGVRIGGQIVVRKEWEEAPIRTTRFGWLRSPDPGHKGVAVFPEAGWLQW